MKDRLRLPLFSLELTRRAETESQRESDGVTECLGLSRGVLDPSKRVRAVWGAWPWVLKKKVDGSLLRPIPTLRLSCWPALHPSATSADGSRHVFRRRRRCLGDAHWRTGLVAGRRSARGRGWGSGGRGRPSKHVDRHSVSSIFCV